MGRIVELPGIKPCSTSRRQGLRKLSPDLISKARDETALISRFVVHRKPIMSMPYLRITPPHPLDGCRAKIDRAKHHIDDLDANFKKFFSVYQHRVVGHFDANGTEYILRAFGVQPTPTFSVIAGEVVHHLRSSLDHLVHALILRNKGTPANNNQFPICLAEFTYKRVVQSGVIKGISPAARAIIDRLQPYQKAKPRDDALAILNKFSNTDKHRLLVVVASAMAIPNRLHIGPGNMADYQITNFAPQNWAGHTVRTSQNGTELLRIKFAKARPDMQVNADFTPQMTFEEFGSRKHESVIPSLMHLHDAVVQTVKLFRGEF
jgi:hypothetical protein